MLVSQAQLEDRIGAATLNRIYSDGSDDGIARIDAIDSLRRDGSSKVLGFIGLVYDVDLIDEANQAEIVRLALDACHAYAAMRHPEFMRGVDGYKMMQQVDKDLKALREGMTNLGIKDPPEPAANHGVRVLSGDPLCPDKFTPRFSDNWGGRGGF
jgi:hypothetical protein